MGWVWWEDCCVVNDVCVCLWWAVEGFLGCQWSHCGLPLMLRWVGWGMVQKIVFGVCLN